MMSASFLATVLIFIVGGAISIFRLVSGESITGMQFTDYVVAGIIFTNAVFFLYIELYTESNPNEINRLRNVHPLQWFLRVINQANLTLIWLWLSFGLVYCLISLFVFYMIILAWDSIVFRNKDYLAASSELENGDIDIVLHDMIGFACFFGFAGAYYFYSADGMEVFSGKDTISFDDFHRVIVLNSMLFLILGAYIWNTLTAIKKANVDFSALLSKAGRF